MKFKSGCQLRYHLDQPSTLIFGIEVEQSSQQRILQETLEIDPNIETEAQTVNGNRLLRLAAASGSLSLRYEAIVERNFTPINPDEAIEVPVATLPLDVLPYLFPSRYCQSDRLMRLATAQFGELKPGYERVRAIADWIYSNVTYLSGSTNSQTSAFDTVTERTGVCRDFAHLGITFCRALSIPARFVAGYAYQLEPPDFHACFEAYLGDRWYWFDPSQLARAEHFVRIGAGRDAADVSFANLFGVLHLEEMTVFSELLNDEPESEAIEPSPAFAPN